MVAAEGVRAQHRSRPADLSQPRIEAVSSRLDGLGDDPGCRTCHGEIENATEEMGFELHCTFCHGGDGQATTKLAAHVQPTRLVIDDVTTAPLEEDLPYQRFVNPSNLRVVDDTCALCHPAEAETVLKNLMTNNAGHVSGGLYQNGVVDTKTPIYGMFAVVDEDGTVPIDEGAVESLDDLITYDPSADPSKVATHYAAVPGQACARCHLWSRGRGYRGAEGEDGTYRADGCVACHMPYADDGLSQSADSSIDHEEPGHPIIHRVTKAIATSQCLHCHHRGARIGLTFTGRAQMPPRLPSGPGVPGTTDERFNRNYHYTDAATNPPDFHHERGLHCIDCHVKSEVMGDGNIWGHMDQATRIECRTCHGTPDAYATFLDNDGLPLPNVDTSGSEPILISKVDGVHHVPLQIKDLVDPASSDYNPRAALAMTSEHVKDEGGLECYACHTSWVPNCYGCHFERDEREVGQNLITRDYEVGKVSTNNKVFEALRAFSMGPNKEGRVAPYIVGCHPIADVTAADGSKILDFKMPSTANGKSGLAHQPVHAHSVRPAGEVRTCVECHRSPPALGLGTGSYSLARTWAFLLADGGVSVFDRWSDPDLPQWVGTIPATTPHALAVLPDLVDGTTDYLYVASGPGGLSVFDLRAGLPTEPVATVTGIDAVDVARVARYLYVVDAGVGVQIYDNEQPETLVWVATVPLPGALRAVPWGAHLFVAAGDDGLVVVDIADHSAPQILGAADGLHAADVALYAHYQMGPAFAVRAYVADPGYGVRIVDLLPDFATPRLVDGIALDGAQALDTYTRYLPADDVVPSREHDYLYVAAGAGGLRVFDITHPDAPTVAGTLDLGGEVVDVDVASQIAPPGVDDYAVVANRALGLQLVEVTDPLVPELRATLSAPGASRAFVDVQQMDRFKDEQGAELKENSHPFVIPFDRDDVLRVLSAPVAGAVEVSCCLPGGCAEMLPDACLAAGGRPGAYAASCEADLNGNGVADSCDRCTLCQQLVFADGFESGDTSAWDVTIP